MIFKFSFFLNFVLSNGIFLIRFLFIGLRYFSKVIFIMFFIFINLYNIFLLFIVIMIEEWLYFVLEIIW